MLKGGGGPRIDVGVGARSETNGLVLFVGESPGAVEAPDVVEAAVVRIVVAPGMGKGRPWAGP